MTKRELRRLYLEKRGTLSEDSLRHQSAAIGRMLSGWLSKTPGIEWLHVFLPAAGKNEVNTFEIIKQLSAAFPALRIAIPRVEAGERRLSHHAFLPQTRLLSNRWGIPEPAADAPVPVHDLDAVLVPMLIFDRSGHRVGYGGGYYDTFLEECRPNTFKIGTCLFDPVDTISDCGPHDILLDLCITPGHTWHFGE